MRITHFTMAATTNQLCLCPWKSEQELLFDLRKAALQKEMQTDKGAEGENARSVTEVQVENFLQVLNWSETLGASGRIAWFHSCFCSSWRRLASWFCFRSLAYEILSPSPDITRKSPETRHESWLVVWNHGILWLSIQLGMSSSQLTWTPSFFKMVIAPPTRSCCPNFWSWTNRKP